MSRDTKAEGCRTSAWRRTLVLAAFAAAASQVVLSASAERRGLLLQPRGPYVPGMRVTVTWEALPPGAEEFELLLRCELPAPLKFRLTECVEPQVRSLDWTVSNVPCQGAALVLRLGMGGHEITWARSEPFQIQADAGEPVPRMILSRGELWVGKGAAPGSLESNEGRRWAAPSRWRLAAESTPTRESAACGAVGGAPGRDSRDDFETQKTLSRFDCADTPQRFPLRI